MNLMGRYTLLLYPIFYLLDIRHIFCHLRTYLVDIHMLDILNPRYGLLDKESLADIYYLMSNKFLLDKQF